MNSCIYQGEVGHYRLMPHQHGFHYNLFMMYLDLDELPELFDSFFFWSAKSPAFAWFRREDHTGDSNTPLVDCIRELIYTETGRRHKGPVRLLTHLRYFGYVMNPVSMYYCWDEADNELEYIVAEVHNTPWGETHCYVLNCNEQLQDDGAFYFRFNKQFHVSPFMGMQQKYEWTMNTPGKDLHINMDNYEGGAKVFTAGMRMLRVPINDKSMTRVLVNFPMMTIKVIGAIYWQALKLWLKKTPFYSHPKYLNRELS